MNDEVKNPAVPRSSFKLHRFLFSLLAAISMLLCVATVGLWMRSYWVEDQLLFCRAGQFGPAGPYRKQWHVNSLNGGVRLTYDVDRFYYFAPIEPTYSTSATQFAGYPYWFADQKDEKLKGLGFQLIVSDWTDSSGPKHATDFVAPWASITIIFAGVATSTLLRIRHDRLRSSGHCAACGYDLRATPERCPECGRTAEELSRG